MTTHINEEGKTVTEFDIFHRVTVKFTDGRSPAEFDFSSKEDADAYGQEIANKSVRGELEGIESVAYSRMGSALIGMR